MGRRIVTGLCGTGTADAAASSEVFGVDGVRIQSEMGLSNEAAAIGSGGGGSGRWYGVRDRPSCYHIVT